MTSIIKKDITKKIIWKPIKTQTVNGIDYYELYGIIPEKKAKERSIKIIITNNNFHLDHSVYDAGEYLLEFDPIHETSFRVVKQELDKRKSYEV